jgi:predicted kinase
MRRRSKREPNNTESTGKIGHELPTNQPRPLVPNYPDDLPRQPQAPREAPAPTQSAPRSHRHAAVAPSYDSESPESGRLEVETQPDMPSLPPQENLAAGRTSADPKGFVVLTIGLPGSGKTTWFKRRGVTPLSSDMLRTILFDDITEQRYQGLVFSTLRSLLRARLIARMPWNYVDATNLSPHERRQWIKMAASFGYEVQAVFFDVPLSVCLERNAKRDRPVSDEVMHKMSERLKAPAFDEGFSKITVVRVKSTT